MIRLPPKSTRPYTLFPSTTLFRSVTTSTAPSVAIGIARITDGSSATKARIHAPCRIVERRETAPAWTLAELRTMTPVIGGEGALHSMLRSEEHTSELQSLMRNLSAVFCLKKNAKNKMSHKKN